jgi:flagellar biosynthesis/type III secretory pathway chaperone
MTDNLVPSFAACVAATLRELKGLLPLLAQEREALLGGDPGALQAIISRKVENLTRVETLLRQTDKLLNQAGYDKGILGGNQLLLAHTHPPELAADWQALQSLSHKIAAMNRVNGQLVSQAKAGNLMALSTITGRTDDQSAYDKRGQGQNRLPGCKLGEA